MSKTLVLASDNAGKLAEIRQCLTMMDGWQCLPQAIFKLQTPAETGTSFVENALQKARHAAERTGHPALADDSGLCVPALNGAPGLYSSRYAGADACDTDNRNKLLVDMQGETQRQACFVCCIVVLRRPDDPLPLICQGLWRGSILHAARGSGGFGYDPVFFDPQLDCSAAELSPEQKRQRSHRGQAMALLGQQLSDFLGSD